MGQKPAHDHKIYTTCLWKTAVGGITLQYDYASLSNRKIYSVIILYIFNFSIDCYIVLEMQRCRIGHYESFWMEMNNFFISKQLNHLFRSQISSASRFILRWRLNSEIVEPGTKTSPRLSWPNIERKVHNSFY